MLPWTVYADLLWPLLTPGKSAIQILRWGNPECGSHYSTPSDKSDYEERAGPQTMMGA
jgi:hypothetical protein